MIYLDDLIRAGAEVMQRGTSQEWRGFAYDSRLAQTDDLFVALQTERADGHLFIKEALAAGVSGIVCSHSPAHVPPDVTVLIAPDGLAVMRCWASNRLRQVATALACSVPLPTIIQRLHLIEPAPGRMRPTAARGGVVLLDDSFNAAPPSMLHALDTLRDVPARRRIAILGEMSQLGAASADYHEKIGQHAALIADVLITKGENATQIARAALAHAAGRTMQITPMYTAAAAIAALPADLGAGDVVLVKGSAEARMERVVAGLLAPDVPADAVLVRQERAWRRLRIGTPDRPTTLRIDLNTLAHNTRYLRERIGVPLMAVLKADAYGHGAVRAARTVLRCRRNHARRGDVGRSVGLASRRHRSADPDPRLYSALANARSRAGQH